MSDISHIAHAILAGFSASTLLIATPLVTPSIAPAAAQSRDSISVECSTALTPHGTPRTVTRLGEVWVPAHVARDWQRYAVENRVHSDDYGWHWISDSGETDGYGPNYQSIGRNAN